MVLRHKILRREPDLPATAAALSGARGQALRETGRKAAAALPAAGECVSARAGGHRALGGALPLAQRKRACAVALSGLEPALPAHGDQTRQHL